MVRQFPDDPGRGAVLCTILTEFAHRLWDRFRQAELDEARACAARAIAVDDLLPLSVRTGRQPRWRLLAMQASIEAARANGDPDRCWPMVERALPTDPKPDSPYETDALIGACISLGRWHLQRGEAAPAGVWVQRAGDLIEANPRLGLAKPAIEVCWLEAQLAATRGDADAAAAAADRILAARSTWLATLRAADCLYLALRCEGAADGAQYREPAVALYAQGIRSLDADVARTPDDPWYVLPWGFANLRAAELAAAAGDESSALEMLAAALPRLLAVRDAAHVDQWHESVVRDGQQLQARLAAARKSR
jgi:hypothetical protein